MILTLRVRSIPAAGPLAGLAPFGPGARWGDLNPLRPDRTPDGPTAPTVRGTGGHDEQ